jgi:hypothetical protein
MKYPEEVISRMKGGHFLPGEGESGRRGPANLVSAALAVGDYP